MTEISKEGVEMLVAAYPDKVVTIENPSAETRSLAHWFGRYLEVQQNDEKALIYKLTEKAMRTASWYAGDRK